MYWAYVFIYLSLSVIAASTNQPTNPDQRTHQPSPAPQHPHKAFVEVLLPACTHITHLSVVRSNCKLTLSRYEYLLLLEETGQAALCVLPHRYGHGGAARQSQTVLWDWTKASSVYLCKDTTSREKPTKSSSQPPPSAIRPPRSVGPLQSPLCSGTCVRPFRLATRLR